MWHLLFAGAAGGTKDVPVSIVSHPLVFTTLTAPSFGPVHSAKKAGSKGGRRCRPRNVTKRCPHNRPTGCLEIHEKDGNQVGEPLCHECYDYEAHIIWQWHAPELWRRFTIALRRRLAVFLGLSESEARKVVRIQFAKVAEYQKRGAVHFHALIRLDGAGAYGDVPTHAGVSSADLVELVRSASASVRVQTTPVDKGDAVRTLRFGDQVDARTVHRGSNDDSALSAREVAAYIAKYATKATEEADPRTRGKARMRHFRNLRTAAKQLALRAATVAGRGTTAAYSLLGKWVDALGYRGHFATKSRTFSTTLGKLRQARRNFYRGGLVGGPPSDTIQCGKGDIPEKAASGGWRFDGMGWLTTGDALLASMASSQARSR
jgi:hypothetical protein